MVFMDAIGYSNTSDQYTAKMMLRELRKAYISFSIPSSIADRYGNISHLLHMFNEQLLSFIGVLAFFC